MHTARLALLLTAIAAGGLSAGCRLSLLNLDKPGLANRLYDLPAVHPQPPAEPPRWSRDLVVAVDDFSMPDKYDARFFRRHSGTEVTADENHRWVQAPNRLLTGVVYDALTESRLFALVVDRASAALPDVRLTGRVLRFEEAPDGAGKRVARLGIACALLRLRPDAPKPQAGKDAPAAAGPCLWQATITGEEPVARDAPDRCGPDTT